MNDHAIIRSPVDIFEIKAESVGIQTLSCVRSQNFVNIPRNKKKKA